MAPFPIKCRIFGDLLQKKKNLPLQPGTYYYRLSTRLYTKSANVYRQIADFVGKLLRNKSNMIRNVLSHVHTCKLSTNNRRTLTIDTSSRFSLQCVLSLREGAEKGRTVIWNSPNFKISRFANQMLEVFISIRRENKGGSKHYYTFYFEGMRLLRKGEVFGLILIHISISIFARYFGHYSNLLLVAYCLSARAG